ncbi:MAG: tryptophan--tRNA ligase, partial [Pseudomonadales bacterium]|nr:tryptophan--tRNA ligase [Pseudomonadales bacterium]
ELAPMRERAAVLEANPDMLRSIIADGCAAAREVAEDTLDEVRSAMGLAYR